MDNGHLRRPSCLCPASRRIRTLRRRRNEYKTHESCHNGARSWLAPGSRGERGSAAVRWPSCSDTRPGSAASNRRRCGSAGLRTRSKSTPLKEKENIRLVFGCYQTNNTRTERYSVAQAKHDRVMPHLTNKASLN